MSLLLSAAWIYIGILSPFLIFCCYDLLKRFPRLCSPGLVFSVVGSSSVILFFDWNTYLNHQPSLGPYSHFLVAGGSLLYVYYLLAFRMRYSRVDSLVLSTLAIIAVDRLWQVPINLADWTTWTQAEIGLTTTAWNLMSLPFLFYFILKIDGRIKLDKQAKQLLALSVAFTALDVLFYYPGSPEYAWYSPYFLWVPWLFFFICVFRASPFMQSKEAGV